MKLRLWTLSTTLLLTLTGAIILFVLYLTSLYSYLLFHSLIELFSIVIACSAFGLVWSLRRYLQNDYLLMVGIAALFVNGLDALHMLAYPGIEVFREHNADLAAQFWLAARYLQSFSFLVAVRYIHRNLNLKFTFTGWSIITVLLAASLFSWELISVSQRGDLGVTPFEIASGIFITLILTTSILLLYRNRKAFDPTILRPLFLSLLTMVGVTFTHTPVFGLEIPGGILGHLLKILSYLFLGYAIAITGFTHPYDEIFKKIKKREEALQETKGVLEKSIEERTAELANSDHLLRMKIVEHQQAEERLRKSQEQLYITLDNILEGCQIIGFDWRYKFINKAAIKQSRQTKDELLNHTMMDRYPGIENTHLFTVMKRCMEERIPHQFENFFTFPDGATGWYELSIQPVPAGIFILSVDITNRKLAEQEIERQVQRLQALRKIDLSIIESSDLGHTLDIILEQITDLLAVDATSILIFRPDLQVLVYGAGRGFRTRAVEDTRIQLGDGIAGLAALDRRTIYVSSLADGQDSFIRKSLLTDENFVTYIAVPLMAKGDFYGVIDLFQRSHFAPDRDWLDFMEILAGQAAIAIENHQLFNGLQRAHADLLRAYDTTIEGWSHALDLRDKETVGHTLRVTELTLKLARLAGLSETELVHVKRGALLHDIGKMGIPDDILYKSTQLTNDEWVTMRKHPVYAYEMLSPIEYLRPALDIPFCHHEKWDGSGYPRGLKGAQIPLAARIFAVIDVWDALRSDRPYRQGWPRERILSYIRTQAGIHFDPDAVDLFLQVVESVPSGEIR
jgi:putative nucleotidyltransferase with HDIG domain/PAS domain S-box-containing protein